MTRLGVRTEQLLRENEQRRESIRRATYGRVEDCIQWIRSRLVSYLIISVNIIFAMLKDRNRRVKDIWMKDFDQRPEILSNFKIQFSEQNFFFYLKSSKH